MKKKKKNKYSTENVNEIRYRDFVNSYEAQKKLIRSFNLMDDTFFAAVMEDTNVCTYVLRIITGIKTLKVRSVNVQYHFRNILTHSVTLDVIAEDENGRIYNIEVQKSDNDHHPKRIRYYQANVDISFLNKGCKYRELPECWFIFISEFDPFGLGDNYYEIERKIKNTDETVSNGVHEIYLNTAVTTEREITKLMEYFRNTDENTEDFGPLSEKVRYYKKDQKGKMIMCDKVQRLIDEASEEKDRKIAKVTMEKNRAVAEKKRAVAERKRMAAEKNRAVAEKKRAVVENKRMAAEKKRAVAENKRMAAEKKRAVVENKRMAAEKNRAVAENKRMAAEIKYLKAQLAAQESRL